MRERRSKVVVCIPKDFKIYHTTGDNYSVAWIKLSDVIGLFLYEANFFARRSR